MVINYKRLNDNTVADSYLIPDKGQLINRIQNKRIFSKFDCKSGFWQVKMHPESIEWTAFSCPEGHYEWLVMPFGLKNAPSIFQRKMDNIFKKYDSFVLVYIDDILVFSKDIEEHIGHLQLVLAEFMKNGIIISKPKIELFKEYIQFLGVTIGNGQIELQEHIAKKILEMPDDLSDLKLLQRFLGLVNYARPFIKNIGKIVGPLYSKTSSTGLKYFNQEDKNIVREVKNRVSKLEKLQLPLDKHYIIIETDGSNIGWGGVLISKPNKYSTPDEEKICGYSSGKIKEKGNMSSIDAEILAITYSLEAFRLFIINKKEFTLRTDCEAIVKYFQRSKENKISRRRWLNLVDIVTGNGYIVIVFE